MSDGNGGFQELAASSERKTEFSGAEQVIDNDRRYRAVIETNKGDITVELFAQEAPRTVNNFVFLALNRFYDGILFHRVLEDFMAQTGDPTGTGRGGPGYSFDDEFADGLKHDSAGTLSMANAGPNSNGSQFFITFAATPWLDGRHAIFGQVIDGKEVLDELQRIDPGRPGTAKPDRIERVTVLEAPA